MKKKVVYLAIATVILLVSTIRILGEIEVFPLETQPITNQLA
ncbi:TPA: hypothetical protein ACGO80_001303 [Streptococcus suis]